MDEHGLDALVKECRIRPGEKVDLRRRDTVWQGAEHLSKAESKAAAGRLLLRSRQALSSSQELLHASDTWSVLVILQGMDASGKDGTIKHVMGGINPQGCEVTSFSHPSADDLDHPFLWRYLRKLPERGRIGIFNRSWYEEVLIVRVRPEILASQRIPAAKKRGKEFWKRRFTDIVAHERHLVENGALVLKFFLHLSKEEQRRRLLARLDDPEKHWKFSASDLEARARWNEYRRAYEDAIEATSTRHAPWYVVPADQKWICRTLVARILERGIDGLALRWPRMPADRLRALEAARRQLANEARKRRG